MSADFRGFLALKDITFLVCLSYVALLSSNLIFQEL